MRINNKELTEKELVGFKKMTLFLDVGVGTKTCEAFLVPADISEKDLGEYAWERALDHGQSFGVYPSHEEPEDFDEEEQGGWDSVEYNTDAISGWFVDYDSEAHDGLLHFGANDDFEWNFL